MKNISEALDDLKIKFFAQNGEMTVETFIELESFFKSTLISLLDEVVPEVTGYAVMSGKIEDKDAPGYEACRQELIKKINEVNK